MSNILLDLCFLRHKKSPFFMSNILLDLCFLRHKKSPFLHGLCRTQKKGKIRRKTNLDHNAHTGGMV